MLDRLLAATLVVAGMSATEATVMARGADTGSATASAEASADEFPESWFWRMGQAGPAHKAMTGKPAPALELRGWVGKDADLKPLQKGGLPKALKGKVVVVDFWATWCGPCRAALPKNVALMNEFGDKGLVVIGVHDAARGHETMEQVAKAAGVEYPLAIDDGGKSARAWKVGFWPTYGVIDRKGVLRAVGLQPQHVHAVVEKLIAEPADGADKPVNEKSTKEKPTKEKSPSLAKPEAGTSDKAPAKPKAGAVRADRIPASMLEGDMRRRSALAPFDLCPQAPELAWATQWMNTEGTLGDARKLGELKGKVVLIDFWATWCGPCIAAVPKMNDLAKKYADKGLVVIGVCRPDGGDRMAGLVKSKGIEYPVCIDSKGDINKAYAVDSFPDYYLIDRQGRLRGADVASGSLEDAVKLLLAEK